MRLKIDFSGRRPLPRKSSILLFLIGISTLAVVAQEYLEAACEFQRTTQTLAGARLKANRQTLQVSPKQVDALNHTVRQLNLPWQSLLSTIEGLVSERVALLTMEPEASTRRLRVQAEAKTFDDMVDFVEALNSSEHFLSAALIRHEINEADRNRPYRFTLEAEWSADL